MNPSDLQSLYQQNENGWGQPGRENKMGEVVMVTASKRRDNKYLSACYNMQDPFPGTSTHTISYNPHKSSEKCSLILSLIQTSS